MLVHRLVYGSEEVKGEVISQRGLASGHLILSGLPDQTERFAGGMGQVISCGRAGEASVEQEHSIREGQCGTLPSTGRSHGICFGETTESVSQLEREMIGGRCRVEADGFAREWFSFQSVDCALGPDLGMPPW